MKKIEIRIDETRERWANELRKAQEAISNENETPLQRALVEFDYLLFEAGCQLEVVDSMF